METKVTWESRKRNREDGADDNLDDTKRAATDTNEEKAKVKSSTDVPTASQFIVPADQFLSLPPELQDVDFTKRVSWRKFAPYTKEVLPLTPEGQEPEFKEDSPALCFHVHATSGRARATTLHLPSSRKVQTPIFMPVGTKGTIKALTTEEICNDPALNCPIILGNTYHLALQPGTELVRDMGGLHKFMRWDRGILTDSGGFQMVSLLKLAEITEDGVEFENPFLKDSKERMMLRPEDSITHQNNIGSDIMMALDDVVSSVTDNDERFEIATYRTLRWLDRCYAAHTRPKEQNLFAIVQGGLDTKVGGLREKCLAGFRARDKMIPGYAIGGLAGGESKEDFWKVVNQCCKSLPDDKPRYLMGVGYPLDLVVCSALGVDMYDCVYPTRTARFGVALVPGEAPGTLRLKSNEFSEDTRVIMEGCECAACKGGYSRARLHTLLKRNNPLAATLMTNHNIAYMMYLVRGMRKAIMEDRYASYVKDFINDQFRGSANGGQDVPEWVRDALNEAGIKV
ncbi:hypothetical protein CTEN210_03977 [Chaetoceros tenuissimus]|uniref:Queuine tRNA-ribosyltransferase catalytic subunit 1 n=1 Tax=Chaetoceros tenuissimus TaxID=426638 RepID=A0AAD3CK12_9STRA|nr:hypothetical protein CTEN210_03977 [Chaetoceros tenuissimus]